MPTKKNKGSVARVASHGKNPFREVDAVLATLHPRHTRTKRAPLLEPVAPARLRQLWEAIGVSDATRALGLPLMTRDESEGALGHIFKAWDASPRDRGAWGGGAEAFRAALPACVRLVRHWKDEIAVTDESGDDPDPAVLVMRENRRPLLTWCRHYTEWLLWRLLGAVARTRRVDFPDGLPGARLLVDGYPPGLRRVAEGIWVIERPKFTRPDEEEQPAFLFYSSMTGYSEHVMAQRGSKIGLYPEPLGHRFWVRAPGPLDLFRGTPDGFRVFTRLDLDGQTSKAQSAIGRAAGTIVFLGMLDRGELSVKIDPRARVGVLAWLKGLGVKPHREEPLVAWAAGRKLSFDAFGW